MKNKSNITATIDGSKYANYINERLNSPGFTVGDMERLRDEPTVLQHIKSLYQVIMHNSACFVDKELADLGYDTSKIKFPRGKIKVLEERDYTVSFTELSEFGKNATNFKALYASIGSVKGLSILDVAERLSLEYEDKSLESLLFPNAKVKIDLIELEQSIDFDFDDDEEGPLADIDIYVRTSAVEYIVKSVLNGYLLNDLITGVKTKTRDHELVDDFVLNYSSINYDLDLLENIPTTTREATKAFLFLLLLRSGKGEGIVAEDIFFCLELIDLARNNIDYLKKESLAFNPNLVLPGSIIELNPKDRGKLGRFFGKAVNIQILPWVSLSFKLLKSSIKLRLDFERGLYGSVASKTIIPDFDLYEIKRQEERIDWLDERVVFFKVSKLAT